jgi:hypothetical protein
MRIANVAAVLVASAAFADAPPQANGIKLGEGRLHASLGVGVGYDTAAGYFAPPMGGTPTLTGDMIVQPNVGLRFGLETPSTLVNFTGTVGYVWYPGITNPSTRELSHVTASVILDTAFNKTGAVEFDIGDILTRSDTSTNTVAGIGLLALYNSAHAALPIHPGGGAIEITPSVAWSVEFFSQLIPGFLTGCQTDISCNSDLVPNMNYSDLQFGLGGKWKFLPKTAVVLDSAFNYRTYFNAQAPIGTTVVNTTTNLPGLVLHVQGGLSGLVTSHISTLLLIGGAGDFGGSGLHTVIGQGEVSYLGQIFTIRGGFVRQLLAMPIFGADIDNRAYLEGRVTANRFSFSVLGGFDYITYALSTRGDELVSVLANAAYQIASFFSIGISYQLWVRLSSNTSLGLNYVRNLPTLNLTVSY